MAESCPSRDAFACPLRHRPVVRMTPPSLPWFHDREAATSMGGVQQNETEWTPARGPELCFRWYCWFLGRGKQATAMETTRPRRPRMPNGRARLLVDDRPRMPDPAPVGILGLPGGGTLPYPVAPPHMAVDRACRCYNPASCSGNAEARTGGSFMLSQQENQRLTQVGAGTPMGELMRRYWHPVAATAELDDRPTKACASWARTWSSTGTGPAPTVSSSASARTAGSTSPTASRRSTGCAACTTAG